MLGLLFYCSFTQGFILNTVLGNYLLSLSALRYAGKISSHRNFMCDDDRSKISLSQHYANEIHFTFQCSIESLCDGVDLNSSVTRARYESLIGTYIQVKRSDREVQVFPVFLFTIVEEKLVFQKQGSLRVVGQGQ